MDAFEGRKWHFFSPDSEHYRFNCGDTIRNRDTTVSVKNLGISSPKASWKQVFRAVVVLEYIGTSAAKAILEEMATGHPDAEPTKAAKLAIERLK